MNTQAQGIGHLAKLIGTDVKINADGWYAVVRVLDLKQAYGVPRLLVEQDGKSAKWVDASRIEG